MDIILDKTSLIKLGHQDLAFKWKVKQQMKVKSKVLISQLLLTFYKEQKVTQRDSEKKKL